MKRFLILALGFLACEVMAGDTNFFVDPISGGVRIGPSSVVLSNGVAVGNQAAAGNNSIAIGPASWADNQGLALGGIAQGANSVALGVGAQVLDPAFTNTIELGSGNALSNGWLHYLGWPIVSSQGELGILNGANLFNINYAKLANRPVLGTAAGASVKDFDVAGAASTAVANRLTTNAASALFVAKGNFVGATSDGTLSTNTYYEFKLKPILNSPAPVPPMSLSTWYVYGTGVTEAGVLAMLNNMVAGDAKRYGRDLLEIDEPPWVGYDTNDLLLIDTNKFPLHGLRPLEWLVQVAGTNGYHIGTYLSPRHVTPGGNPCGLLGHDVYKNATNFADIGIRWVMVEAYNTYDGPYFTPNEQAILQQFMGSWQTTGKPVVWMSSATTMNDWLASSVNIVNLTYGLSDNSGSWTGFNKRLDNYINFDSFVGPNHYLTLGVFYTPHQFRFNLANWQAYQSQINAMSMFSAPWVSMSHWDNRPYTWYAGTESSGPANFGCTFLQTNLDLIALDQDPLVKPATLIWSNNLAVIYAKPLKELDGTLKAVMLLNRSTNDAATFGLNFASVFPAASSNDWCSVYDPVYRTWLGYVTNGIAITLPPYGSKIYRLELHGSGWPAGTNWITAFGPMGVWHENATNGFQTADIDTANLRLTSRGWRWNGNNQAPLTAGSLSRNDGTGLVLTTTNISIRTTSGTNFYAHGVGIRPMSHLEWSITGATRFATDFGYDGLNGVGGGSATITISLDGTPVYTKTGLTAGQVAHINLDTTGSSLLAVDVTTTNSASYFMALGDPYIYVPPVANLPLASLPEQISSNAIFAAAIATNAADLISQSNRINQKLDAATAATLYYPMSNPRGYQTVTDVVSILAPYVRTNGNGSGLTNLQATNLFTQAGVLTATGAGTTYSVTLLPGELGNTQQIYLASTNCTLSFTGTNIADASRTVLFRGWTNPNVCTITLALPAYHTNATLSLVVTNGTAALINFYNPDTTGTNVMCHDIGRWK